MTFLHLIFWPSFANCKLLQQTIYLKVYGDHAPCHLTVLKKHFVQNGPLGPEIGPTSILVFKYPTSPSSGGIEYQLFQRVLERFR